MTDKKISEFIGTQELNDADIITVVQNGTNKKISKSDFVNDLGVSGTIVQEGSITGTPILDTQGTINNIRNIEDGSGVQTNISPENGITIAHNFDFDQTGVSLTPDATAQAVSVRSLVGSAGISVGASGDTIQFALTSTPVSTKTIIVNVLGDLPAPSAGVITLADDTDYLISNDLDIGVNRFVMGANTEFRGVDQEIITVTATLGSGDLFTATNKICAIRDIAFNISGMRLMNFTGSGIESLTMEAITTIGATSVCNFDGGKLGIIKRIVCDGCVDGITLAGAIETLLIQDNIFETCTSSFLDFGTAVLQSGTAITNQIIIGAAGNSFKGLANSANIGGNSIFTIVNNKTFDTGLGLSGLDETDVRFQYGLNDYLSDTRVDSLLSLQSNATATVIAAAGTPVLVAGTWTVETASQMTGTVGGRATLDSVKRVRVPMGATLSMSPVSGGSKSISVQIAINGVAIPNSKRTGTTSGGSDTSITCLWQADLATGDYVEVFVANEDDTTNILVSAATFRIN